MMLNMPKERHQVKYVKLSLLFWLLSNLSIYHFRCYSMLFLPLYLSFHLDSPHRHPDSPHFSYFHPDSPNSPYSVLQFPILAFTDSLLSLYSLRIYFRKIVALVQKWTLPFLLLHNSRHQIIIYIIYDVISVITKNYLPYSASSKKSIICEVWANNSEWLKCYLSFMSKGGTTCPKLSIFS